MCMVQWFQHATPEQRNAMIWAFLGAVAIGVVIGVSCVFAGCIAAPFLAPMLGTILGTFAAMLIYGTLTKAWTGQVDWEGMQLAAALGGLGGGIGAGIGVGLGTRAGLAPRPVGPGPEAPRTVRVYRVEGEPNTRVMIGKNGEVAIVGNDERTLWLNFGQRDRAEVFLAKRELQQMKGAQIKSFEVREEFVSKLRQNAVPEFQRRANPTRPIIGDATKAPYQFGLQAAQIAELRNAIIPGSGALG